MKTTRFAQESAAQAQAEAQETRTTPTAGQWNAFRYPDCRTWTVASGKSVASRIECEADAKLIAAAPDLLRDLQAVLQRFDAELGILTDGRYSIKDFSECVEALKTISKTAAK